MTANERPWLIGLHVDDGPGLAYGAVRGQFCAECGGETWLAPKGLQIIADLKARLICNRCARDLVSDEPELLETVMPPDDEQVREINQIRASVGLPPLSPLAILEVAKGRLVGRGRGD